MSRKTLQSLLFTFVLLSSIGASAKDAVPLADDPVTEQRLIVISEEMRCLVCQNESLAGSRSDLANDLRREIRILINDGKTFIILLAGIIGLMVYLRRRNQAVPSTTLSEADNRRIDALLQDAKSSSIENTHD